MAGNFIIDYILDGDKRSLAGVPQVVSLIKKDSKLIGSLLSVVSSEQEAYNMRALDAIEKATRDDFSLLQPYKKIFINQLIYQKQKEIRWHVAQIISRFKFTKIERHRIANILIEDYLKDDSSIVKTNTLHALTEIALSDEELSMRVKPIIKRAIRSGTRAMAARAKKLLLLLSESNK